MNRTSLSFVFLLLTGISFTQNLIPFEKNGKFGFRKNEQEIIPAGFDYVCNFTEGLALVKTNGKWGFIDSTGSWKINAEFDKAQPFVEGFSYIEKNHKVGLLKRDGSFAIKPEYENIIEEYDGYNLIGENKQRGYLSKEAGIVIPPKYLEITRIYDACFGKNANGTFDIYYKGKIQVKEVGVKPTYSDFDYTFETILLTSGGLTGLFKFDKGWIIPQEYAWIGVENFPEYELNGYSSKINYIYSLHQKDLRNFDPEAYWDYDASLPIDSILFVKVDGTPISPLKFNTISKSYDSWAEIQTGAPIQLTRDGFLYNINSNFLVEKLRFSSILPIANEGWSIAESSGMNYLLNRNQFVVDSFPSITQYHEYTYNPEVWTDYGEPEMQWTAVNEPFLIVRNTDGEGMLNSWGIYSLTEQRRITPWLKGEIEREIQINRFQFAGDVLYSYGFGENVGFYTRGMEIGTDLNYSYGNLFPSIYNNFYAMKVNGEETIYELYQLKDSKVTKTYSGSKIYSSDEFRDNVWTIDPETGEEYLNEIKLFELPFFVLEDKNIKFGLVAQNGTVIAPKYDFITKNPENSTLIAIGKDNKFGNVYLPTGDVIEPIGDSILHIQMSSSDEAYPLGFSNITSGNENYYVDLKGNKFMCLTESVYPQKFGKKYALVGYSNLVDQDNDQLIQVPANFKMLEPTEILSIFKAKGLNKKWGYINFIGDTIVPFRYDKVQLFYGEIVGSENMVRTTIKKKKGIVHITKGEIIPAEYNSIEQFAIDDYFVNAFIVMKDNKKGVISPNGEVLFECKYDRFEVMSNENYFDSYILIGIADGIRDVQIYGNTNYDVSFDAKQLKSYDFIIAEEGYIKKGNNFEVYELRTGFKINVKDANNISKIGNTYDIKMLDGKFGAIDKNGKELIPCIYDIAQFFDGRDEVMIGYEKGVKYYIYVFTNERYTEQEW